jgi:hypothetical protein
LGLNEVSEVGIARWDAVVEIEAVSDNEKLARAHVEVSVQKVIVTGPEKEAGAA